MTQRLDLLHLQHGRTRVDVAPALGGRIAQIAVNDGRAWLPLLRAPEDMAAADPLLWGSYVMAPWPNRIASAAFEFEGERYALKPNDGPHALHGLAFDQPWSVERRGDDACTLSLSLRELWPFGGRVEQSIIVFDDGLEQEVIVAADDVRFPAGIGWHPWFRRDVGGSGGASVQVDASQRYELDAMIPTGRLLDVSGDHDMRGYTPLGARRLDDCYRTSQPPCIRWGDIELTMTSGPNVGHAVVYTTPDAVCIEPQTCAIDAFNLAARGIDGSGTYVVEPGRSLVARTKWRWSTQGPR